MTSTHTTQSIETLGTQGGKLLGGVGGIILRPCRKPGCSALVERGYCTKHASAPDENRPTSTARGYDEGHRTRKVLCHERDQWRCVDCNFEPDLVKTYRALGMGLPPTSRILEELRQRYLRHEQHLHADHVLPIDERPDLQRDLDNLQTRCNICHARKTRREHPNAIWKS